MDDNRKEQGAGTGTFITKKIEAVLDKMDLDKEMDVIGLKSHFKGNFYFGPYTRIEGKLEGSIESTGILIISSTAQIKADIKGKTVIVDGLVEGNIHAEECAIIQEHGIIIGNVKAPCMQMDHGANINGVVSMGKYHTSFIELETLAEGS